MGEKRELTLRPIGRVIRGQPCPEQDWPEQGQPDQDNRWAEEPAEIEIDAAWAEALDGVEGFSHIWVVWWLDRFETTPTSLHVHPQRRQDMPLVGLFATRSPHRPCPIAITVVRLLERREARLVVQGLDACQGTAIIDIKPYLRRGDLVADATAPEWLEELWVRHDDEQRARGEGAA